MSFLDSLITVGGAVVGGFLGGPAGAAAGAGLASAIVAPTPSTGGAPPPTFIQNVGTAVLGALTPTAGPAVAVSTAARTALQINNSLAAQQVLRANLPIAQQRAAVAAIQAGASPGSALGPVTGLRQVSGLSAIDVAAQAAAGGVGPTGLPLGGDQVLQVPAGIAAARPGVGVFRRTMVQTIDRATGQLISFKFFDGAPFLMNKDIVAAKRVFRLSNKLHNRLPRRSVRKKTQPSPLEIFVANRALTHQLAPASSHGG